MHFFLQSKVKALGGDPAKLVRLVRYGATTSFGKVVVASVPASHTNGLSPAFLEKEQAQALVAAGLTAYVGPAGGFVLRFSNGLTAYLSGDTGITAEQDVVVRRFHRANLAVMSVGGAPNMNGPLEAAYVMNELVQPNSDHHHACERAGDRRRQGSAQHQDRRLHQGGESAGARAAQW